MLKTTDEVLFFDKKAVLNYILDPGRITQIRI